MANINIYLSYAHHFTGEYQSAKELLNNTVLPIYQQPFPRVQPEERELLDLLRIVSFKNNVNDQMRNTCDLSFVLIMLGLVQYFQGAVPEAAVFFNNAREVFGERQLDNISQMYKMDVLRNIGLINSGLGQFVEAEKIMKRVKTETDKLYVNHPHRNEDVYLSMARLLYLIGKFQDAIKLLHDSLKIKRMHFSPQHIIHIDVKLALGFTNLIVDVTDAEQNFKQVEKMCESYSYKNTYIRYVDLNLGLWKTYEFLGKYDKARIYMYNTLKFIKSQ